MTYAATLLCLCVLQATNSVRAVSVQECKVRVLQPITDDLENHWQPGQTLAVTIERNTPSGGSYCASGGSCLSRKVSGVDAVQLLNCKPGSALESGDWSLAPDPLRLSPAAVKVMRSRDDAEQTLSRLGFSNAAAGTLADEYTRNPQSSTGHTVARALAGSQSAIAKLKQHNP